MSLGNLTKDSFLPYLKNRFSAGTFELELVDVRALGGGLPQGRAPFSLVFQAGDEVRRPQQIYELTHPELGKLAIFLVPIAPGRYEAVFG